MDLIEEEERLELKNDENDLFAALVALGEANQEYDAEKDALVTVFKRAEQWKEALGAIRKLLKKYHTHRDLPMHACMAKWRALQNRLLPMVERYSADSEMLYNMGKVLVFLTHPLNPHPGGTRDLPLHAADMRDGLVTIARNRHFLPAFLNLIAPALDPSIAEKSERDMNSVDIVITVLDQLAAIPNGCAQDVAGTSELLVLELKKSGMIGLLTSLAALTERREFRRIVPVLLDLIFELVRGQDGEGLLKAHLATAARQQAAAARASKPAATASSKTSPSATVIPKTLGGGVAATGSASVNRTSPSSLPSSGPASGANSKRTSPTTVSSSAAAAADPLKALMRAERDTKAAQLKASGSDRHSRFGIQAYVRAVGGGGVATTASISTTTTVPAAGAGEGDEAAATTTTTTTTTTLLAPTSIIANGGTIFNNTYKRVITGFTSDMAGSGIDYKTATSVGAGTKQMRYHPNAASSKAAGLAAKKGKNDLYRQELFLDIYTGVGATATANAKGGGLAAMGPGAKSAAALAASAGGVSGGSAGAAAGAPQDLFANKDTMDRARAALYELAARLLAFSTPPPSPSSSSSSSSSKDAKAKDNNNAVIAIDQDEEDDEGANVAPPAFVTLAQRVKFLISRDSSDLVREDPLRYMHAAGVIMAVHRAGEAHRIRVQTEEAKKLLNAAAQWKLQQALQRKQQQQQQQQGDQAATTAAASSLPPQERLYDEVLRNGVLVPGMAIEPVLELVDQWSWARCQQMLSSYLDAKQWRAASIVIAHLKELLVFVHAINDPAVGNDTLYAVPARVVRALETAHEVEATDPTKFFSSLQQQQQQQQQGGARRLTLASSAASAGAPIDKRVLDLDEGEPRPAGALVLPWNNLSPSSAASLLTPLSQQAQCPEALALAALRDIEARKPLAGVQPQAEEKADATVTTTPAADAITAVAPSSLASYIRQHEQRLGAGEAGRYYALWSGAAATEADAASMASAVIARYRPCYIPSAASYLAESLLEDLYSVYRDELLGLLPKAFKLNEPGRFDWPTLAALLEASHYALKMAETAAVKGLQSEGTHSKGRGRKGGKGTGKRLTTFTGDDDDDSGSDNDDAKDKKKNKKAQSSSADANDADITPSSSSERLYELEKFASEYAHPQVVKSLSMVLLNYKVNSPRTNYFAVSLMRRLASLPNDYAGVDTRVGSPTYNQPFTYQVLLFTHGALSVAHTLLNDKHALATVASPYGSAAADNYRPLISWAKDLVFAFLKECSRNRMMWVEALFTRSEKSALADLSRHYGYVDGSFSYYNEEEGRYVASTADPSRVGAHGEKKRSAAAQARHDAALQAEHNAVAKEDDEQEAQLGLDSDSDDEDVLAKRKLAARKKAANNKRKRASSDEEDSDSGSSSGSDSSSGGSEQSTPAKRRRIAAADDEKGDASDADDDSTAGGRWKPVQDAALRRLYPSYAALALAAVGYQQQRHRQKGKSSASAASSSSSVSTLLQSRIIAPLLQRDPLIQAASPSSAAEGSALEERLQALQLQLKDAAAEAQEDNDIASSFSQQHQLPLYLRPLYHKVSEDSLALFMELGRREPQTTQQQPSHEDGDEDDDDLGYGGGAGESSHHYRDLEGDDTSSTAALQWLSELLRKAADAREQAEQKARAEAKQQAARAAREKELASTQGDSSVSTSASAMPTQDFPLSFSSASFGGFSQGGGTFKLAVQALLAAGGSSNVELPAGVPVQAMVAAARQLGVEWAPPPSSSASSSSSSSDAADAANEDDGDDDLLSLSSPSAAMAVPDIPLLPITTSQFQWFNSTPSFAALLQDVGICRVNSVAPITTSNANNASAKGREAWWRIPGCVPSASLAAAADAIDAVLASSGSSSSSSGDSSGNISSNEQAYNALIPKGVVLKAPAPTKVSAGKQKGKKQPLSKKAPVGSKSGVTKKKQNVKQRLAAARKARGSGSDSDDSSSSSSSASSSSSESEAEEAMAASSSSSSSSSAAPAAAGAMNVDDNNDNHDDEGSDGLGSPKAPAQQEAASPEADAEVAPSKQKAKGGRKLLRRSAAADSSGDSDDSEDEGAASAASDGATQAVSSAAAPAAAATTAGGRRSMMVIADDEDDE